MRYVTAIFCVAMCAAAMPARAFDFADARQLITASDPQISPDGTRVVYIRGQADFSRDRSVRQLMLVDVRTHEQRALTWDRKDISSPRWSRTGDAIAFIAEDNDGEKASDQIFVLRMDGGDAQQITHAKNGVNGFAWSPDGRRFAYTMQDDDPNPDAAKTHLDAFQVQDNDYLHRSATPPVHIWICNADGSHAHRLTSGSWSVANADPDGGGDISWSPDSRTIAFEYFPTPFIGDSLTAYVALLDAANGRVRRVTPNQSMETLVAYAPHADAIAYVRNTGGDAMNGNDVYVVDSAGKNVADLRTRLDRNVDAAVWDARSQALWLAAPDATRTSLFYWPIHGRVARVDLGGFAPGEIGNTSDGGALVITATSTTHPSEVYLVRSASSPPVALTGNNAFVAKTGIAREVGIDWHSTKGNFTEDGVLIFPLNAPARCGGPGMFEKALRVWLRAPQTKFGAPCPNYPLVLLIHGGPQGASTLTWSTQAQVFASHGFFVFEPNYRGSTNLGDAYQHAIANDTGDGPGKDVMAGLAAVEHSYPIDTSRIGVSGWSYGGYMTSWLIGHYHVWKAAVSGASLDDWLDDYDIAFYYNTDVPFFRGKPWNPSDTAEWREQSPIAFAQNATAPTLIMGDIGDNNVPITNSFKLYHALKDNGTTAEFVAYPVAGHFPSDAVRAEDVEKRWLNWLEQYLK